MLDKMSKQSFLMALVLVGMATILVQNHFHSKQLQGVASGAPSIRDLTSQVPSTTPAFRTKRKLQVVKAGGIPKEGLGSSLGFITATANIAHLLDADLIITQTAEMMGYRVSDILNKGLELEGGGRVCDIMEILLDDPGTGTFQGRMDRAQGILDETYERAIKKCSTVPTEILLSDYAMKEINRCDTIVINDYRTISRGWTHCSMSWWKSAIEQYSPPAIGNDVAIHFRWGDMYHKATTEDKWKLEMVKVAKIVDIIRQEKPDVIVNVFMKKSKENESEKRMREILQPLSGKFNIIEAETDVEELSMMAKAEYLIINSGSYSTAAAATGNAKVVVFNNGGAHHTLGAMGLKHLFNYDDYEESQLRAAIKDN
jgi:hypothetical protein